MPYVLMSMYAERMTQRRGKAGAEEWRRERREGLVGGSEKMAILSQKTKLRVVKGRRHIASHSEMKHDHESGGGGADDAGD